MAWSQNGVNNISSTYFHLRGITEFDFSSQEVLVFQNYFRVYRSSVLSKFLVGKKYIKCLSLTRSTNVITISPWSIILKNNASQNPRFEITVQIICSVFYCFPGYYFKMHSLEDFKIFSVKLFSTRELKYLF